MAGGPQASITCPVGAVPITTGTNLIQAAVAANPAGTTFCLAVGVHAITSAITPKTGQTFVGQFGAIVDGTGWVTTDIYQGAFRAHNQDIDNVTIRNLTIRNMPQKAVHALYNYSSGWVVEDCEITANKDGIQVGSDSMVRNNHIHHNLGCLRRRR